LAEKINFGKGGSLERIDPDIEMLLEAGEIDATMAKILKQAALLQIAINKSEALFNDQDNENVSLEISTKLNMLNHCLLNLEYVPKGMLRLPPKEEILNMCKSGKDRTGLAMHDQSARVIAERLKADIKDVDNSLLAAGHNSQQAGGVHSGGSSVGAFGTISHNANVVPRSRKDELSNIVEETGNLAEGIKSNDDDTKNHDTLAEEKEARVIKLNTELNALIQQLLYCYDKEDAREVEENIINLVKYSFNSLAFAGDSSVILMPAYGM
jgi:hypothetical protein